MRATPFFIHRKRSSVLTAAMFCASLLSACATTASAQREGGDRPPTYTELFEECAEERRFQRECGGASASREAGSGSFRGGIAVALSSDTTVSNEFMGSELLLSVAGHHDVVWWSLGGGALHLFDGHAYGFSLAALTGFPIPTAREWSIVLGAKFLNVSDFYDDDVHRPAHHVLGQLGVDFVAVEYADLLFRLTLRVTLGAERQRVARFDQAREAVDEKLVFEYGGALALSLWLR